MITSTNWPYFLLFILLFFGLFRSIVEYKYPLLTFIVLAAILSIIQRKTTAVCVLYADHDKLTVEVVKKGFETRVFATEYRWKELENFQYNTDSDGDLTVYLKWQDGSSIHFTNGETKAFRDHLRTFFPEKETKYHTLFYARKQQSS